MGAVDRSRAGECWAICRRWLPRSPANGCRRFKEHGPHGTVTYEVIADEPPRLFATSIVDRDLGYSGSWTYSFAPEGSGTRVMITENGEVSNAIFRFMSRFVFGYTGNIERTLVWLAARRRGASTSPR